MTSHQLSALLAELYAVSAQMQHARDDLEREIRRVEMRHREVVAREQANQSSHDNQSVVA